ncbi:serine hydrolase domain-containing protein [Chachezhania sediminis]|uniref:serine hydrolase domain-containing protein n=1 Tax=Chachezhania sediminis TaxID=2599291 RepID=UPI00131EA5BE|nr:serine hydrolase domain-containing protein [Chachezhania sediminis]
MLDSTRLWARDIPCAGQTVRLQGRIAPGFEALADTFADNFLHRGEAAASCHAIWKGAEVAHLWGGVIDGPDGTAGTWQDDTLSIIFSATKPATAACIHLLARDGRIDLDAPVATWWPEFAQAGKDAITVRMVLDHTAGLPALRPMLKPDCLMDHAYMADHLAAEAPFFDPGSRTAYHPVTGGFILAELVRRIEGKTLGQVFADRVAGPLGLDFWIGLPPEQETRVALIRPFVPEKGGAPTPFGLALRDKGSLPNLFFFNHGTWMARDVNTGPGRAAEIGAASGVTNAQGLARFFDALRPDGTLGLTTDAVESFGQATSATHADGMLLQPTRFGPGFMLHMDNRRADGPPAGDSFRIGPRAFGHVGAGGSFGFRDPETDLSMAYTMTRMGPGFLVNPRGQGLIDAAFRCIAASA